jgi:hypothetical protein
MIQVQTLYETLSRLGLDKKKTKSLLETIHRKGLQFSVERLAELPKVTTKLSWEVSTRWKEAVACYAYGQHNAAIALAAAACEVQFREQLAKKRGNVPKGTYGKVLMLREGYAAFVKKHPGSLSQELWNLHKRMVEDCRNPYVHMDMDTLAQKRKIAVAGPPDFTMFYRGLPRLSDPDHRFFDRLALRFQENDPSQSALECMKLAHSILHGAPI